MLAEYANRPVHVSTDGVTREVPGRIGVIAAAWMGGKYGTPCNG